ncbi:hypothetical protein QOT17_015871 [Balamuthia mandrillaris]
MQGQQQVGTVLIKSTQAKQDERQVKIFTNWANFILRQRNLMLNSIMEDLSNGLLLIQLVEILTKDNVDKYNKRPMLLAQKVENVEIAVRHLQKHGYKDFDDFAASEIVRNNRRVILSFFWQLILRFQLSDYKSGEDKEGELVSLQREVDALLAESESKKKSAGTVKKQRQFIRMAKEFSAWVDDTAKKVDGERDFGSSPQEVKAYGSKLEDKENALRQESKKKLDAILTLWVELEAEGSTEDLPQDMEDLERKAFALEEAIERRRAAYAEQTKKAARPPFVPIEGKTFASFLLKEPQTKKGESLKDRLDQVDITVSDPSGNEVSYQLNEKAQKVYFQPLVSGKFVIHARYDGDHIKGSPFNVTVSSKEEDLYKKATAEFSIVARNAEGGPLAEAHEFDVKVNGPGGKEFASTLKHAGGGNFKVVFKPTAGGKYTINVKLRGEHVGSSPYELNFGGSDGGVLPKAGGQKTSSD